MTLEQFSVEVSLNGQQFSNQTQDGGYRQFVAYEPPRLERTFPDTGPIGAEGALQLNGTNFVRGSDYVCDFWVDAPVRSPSPSPHQPAPAPAPAWPVTHIATLRPNFGPNLAAAALLGERPQLHIGGAPVGPRGAKS